MSIISIIAECKKIDFGETSLCKPGFSSSSAGFTLIEVLVAICLLSVALLSMVSLTAMVVKGNAYSKVRTTATTLAKDKLEELKNSTYLNLEGTDGTDYATSTGAVQTSASGAYYTRVWDIAANDPADNVKTVTITVSWGTDRNVILRTIVAR